MQQDFSGSFGDNDGRSFHSKVQNYDFYFRNLVFYSIIHIFAQKKLQRYETIIGSLHRQPAECNGCRRRRRKANRTVFGAIARWTDTFIGTA